MKIFNLISRSNIGITLPYFVSYIKSSPNYPPKKIKQESQTLGLSPRNSHFYSTIIQTITFHGSYAKKKEQKKSKKKVNYKTFSSSLHQKETLIRDNGE